MKKTILMGAFVLLAVAAAIFWLTRPEPAMPQELPLEKLSSAAEQNKPEAEPPAPLPQEPEPQKQTEKKHEPELVIEVGRAPTLDNSDEFVQKVLATLNPALLQWFNQDELARKTVIAVDRVARGDMPKNYLPLRYAKDRFGVESQALHATETGQTYTAAAENYPRFEPLLNALYFIKPEILAAYYHDWLPILEQAYGEIAEQGTFDQRFEQALQQVLSAPELPDDAVLIQPHVLYQYQNKQLESANAVHKFVWRLGNENRRKLQSYLTQLKSHL